jgi:predicted acyltransferase
MFLMMAEVLMLEKLSLSLPESSMLSFFAYHQTHVEWRGASLHDLIQPSFSFLVGVAMPFSIFSRKSKGQNENSLFIHILKRSFILILLGVFLRSLGKEITYWTFEDTLSQIGLGYTFLYFIYKSRPNIQKFVFTSILIGYGLAYAIYPVANSNFNWETVGVAQNWEHLMQGFSAHWNKNYNLGNAFDQWFLNLFPRESPFVYNSGGYLTLSFIPTLATMVLGLWAGDSLFNKTESNTQIKKFLIIGLILITVGFLLDLFGICPNVKRIWTPSWVLFSGGCCYLFLSLFLYLSRFKVSSKMLYFLQIIGINSIAAYLIAHVLPDFISSNLKIHLYEGVFNIFGNSYHPLVLGTIVLLIELLILRWMYKNKIFIKI